MKILSSEYFLFLISIKLDELRMREREHCPKFRVPISTDLNFSGKAKIIMKKKKMDVRILYMSIYTYFYFYVYTYTTTFFTVKVRVQVQNRY